MKGDYDRCVHAYVSRVSKRVLPVIVLMVIAGFCFWYETTVVRSINPDFASALISAEALCVLTLIICVALLYAEITMLKMANMTMRNILSERMEGFEEAWDDETYWPKDKGGFM